MAMVLCTGADSMLLETRKLILEKAGHTVVPARDQVTVIAACNRWDFDVAVIGQSISPENKRIIGTLIRQHCPESAILELYPAHQSKILDDADAWLAVPVDVPQELAERVGELVNRKTWKRCA